jgi:hypothetical protein
VERRGPDAIVAPVDSTPATLGKVNGYPEYDDDELENGGDELDGGRVPGAEPPREDDDVDLDEDSEPDFDEDMAWEDDIRDERQGAVCQAIVSRVTEDRETLFAFVLDVLEEQRVRHAFWRQAILVGELIR